MKCLALASVFAACAGCASFGHKSVAMTETEAAAAEQARMAAKAEAEKAATLDEQRRVEAAKWRDEYRANRTTEIGLDFIGNNLRDSKPDAELSVTAPIFSGFAVHGAVNTLGGAGAGTGNYGWRAGIRLY